jgi:hypothetical protein
MSNASLKLNEYISEKLRTKGINCAIFESKLFDEPKLRMMKDREDEGKRKEIKSKAKDNKGQQTTSMKSHTTEIKFVTFLFQDSICRSLLIVRLIFE